MHLEKPVREVFAGVFRVNEKLSTRSLAPGIKVYGEDLNRKKDCEYRAWDLFRSKLAGAIQKGLHELPIKPGGSVLYLGAASGTTASHVADIVGEDGIVYCVEMSPRTVRDLVRACEVRPNMVPLLADARFPAQYASAIEEESEGRVDVIYQDVADPEQTRIIATNANAFLQKGGAAMLCLKARSIDATVNPQEVFRKTKPELEKTFEILQEINLDPFDKDHLFYNLRKK